MIIIVTLLYLVILNVLLLITGYFSLKIVKNTIGKNIKDQFNKKHFRKVFWFTTLSYVIGLTVLAFWSCHDFASYLNNAEILLFAILFPIYYIVTEPNTASYLYADKKMLVLFIIVILSFFVSVIFNYFIVFKKLDITKSKRFCAALIVSAMTAPYFYFVSFSGLLS